MFAGGAVALAVALAGLPAQGQPVSPVVTLQPTNVTATAGQDVVLAVIADGQPPLSYQWFFNGSAFADATNSVLQFPDVRITNAGVYQVVITNSVGSITSEPAQLIIQSAPTNAGSVDLGFFPPTSGLGWVNALAIQGDGKILIGGSRLVRVGGDGTLDNTFASEISESFVEIQTVNLAPDGKIVFTGDFANSNEPPHPKLARLNSDGSIDLSFVSDPLLTNVEFTAAAVQSSGKVLLTPLNTGLGFQYPFQYPLLLRLRTNGITEKVLLWSEFTQGANSGPVSMYALALQKDGKILVADDQLVRLQSSGAGDRSFFNPGLAGRIQCMLQQPDGKILVGRSFPVGPQTNIARVNADGSLDLTFNAGSGADGDISSLALQRDGKVLLAGAFSHVNGTPRNSIARLIPDGTLDLTFDPGADLKIYSDSGQTSRGVVRRVAVQDDGKILIGGSFDHVNGALRRGLARLECDAPKAPSIAGQPQSKLLSAGQDAVFWTQITCNPPAAYQWQFNGALLQGATSAVLRLTNVQPAQAGEYSLVATNAFGAVTSSVAVLTVTTPQNPGTPDLGFFPGFGADDTVYAVVEQTDGKVLIGGAFSQINGVPRSHLARLDSDGTLDDSFDAGLITGGLPTTVRALIVQADGKILIGGSFTNVNGTTRDHVARLNADGTVDAGFDPGGGPEFYSQAVVYALGIQPDGKVFVGGYFTAFSNTNRSSVARLNADGSLDLSFNAVYGYGTVYALALQGDGKILAGGDHGLARFTPLGASSGFTQTGISGTVYSLALQNDGKVLTGGGFAARMVRLLTNGLPDTNFNAQIASGSVRSITLHNCGTILIGGSFGFTNTTSPSQQLARLQIDGSVDSTFTPGVIDGTVWAITVQSDNHVLISGDFSTAKGVARAGIARLLGDARIPPPIVSQPASQTVIGGQNVLLSVASANCPDINFQWQLNGTNILGATNSTLSLTNVHATNAGSYTVLVNDRLGTTNSRPAPVTVQREPRNPGSVDIDFYPSGGMDGTVNCMALQADGKLVIAGNFTSAIATRIARCNLDGSLDKSFITAGGANSNITAVAVQPDGKILIAGGFSSVGGSARRSIARLDQNGALDASFASDSFYSGTDNLITSMAVQNEGKIVVGGYFTRVGAVGRTGIARLYSDGTTDTNFASGGTRYVLAVASQPDGKVLVGGTFTTVGLIERTRIARLNLDGHADGSFDPQDGPNSTVNAVALTKDNKVVIGGAFTSVNGLPRNRIARLNSDGSVDSSFDPGAGPNFSVWAITVQNDGKVLIGGTFQAVNGTSRNHIARLNPDGSLDTSFDPGPGADNTVLAIAADNSGKIFIGGSFSQYNGLPRDRVARINGDLLLFNPVRAGNTFHLSVFTFPGEIYHLEFNHSLDPANWNSLPGVAGDGTVKMLEDQSEGDAATFYRVRRE